MDYFDDLTFCRCGYCEDFAPFFRNHRFDGYYGIQFIIRGSVTVKAGDVPEWHANGPFIFFTSPDRPFSYGNREGTRDHIFICFKGPRVQRYINGGLIPQDTGRLIPVLIPDALKAICEKLLLTLRKRDAHAHGEAVLLLERILLLIHCQPTGIHRGLRLREYIMSLTDQIANHPEKPWSSRMEAQNSNVSQVHFRRMFSQITAMPFWQYVLNSRIRYACQLLSSTNLLIKEIAGKCGFKSEFNFSRQFHKITAVTPEQYRKQS